MRACSVKMLSSTLYFTWYYVLEDQFESFTIFVVLNDKEHEHEWDFNVSTDKNDDYNHIQGLFLSTSDEEKFLENKIKPRN